MRFTSPQYFWLLFLLLPVAWRVLATERFLNLLRLRFRVDRNGKSPRRLFGRCLLPLLSLACLVTALAGPTVSIMRTGTIRDNLALAIGIDVSKSMLAEDVVLDPDRHREEVPISNRLNAARRLTLSLLRHMDGEKIGLFFFARNGIEVVSPTRDPGFLRYMATHTDLSDLTESGSNLLAALESGTLMIDSQTGIPARATVIITDGEDTENPRSAILQYLSAHSRTLSPVFTIGIGRENDVFIPVRRKGASDIDGFYMDNEGIPLKTRLDAQILREIATATGGNYYDLSKESSEKLTSRIMQDIASGAAAPVNLPPRRAPFDLSPLFLLACLAFYIPFLLL